MDPVNFRAKVIFGALIILLLVSLGSSIYTGVKTGKFTAVKEYLAEVTKPETTPVPTVLPSPTLTVMPTPTATVKPAPVVQTQAQPAVQNCVYYNIREGEFASNKCYSQTDYDDLFYYLNKFNNAVFNKDAAQSSMKITCDCTRQSSCDFFKASCDKDKASLSQAEADIAKYRGVVQGIIAKGR